MYDSSYRNGYPVPIVTGQQWRKHKRSGVRHVTTNFWGMHQDLVSLNLINLSFSSQLCRPKGHPSEDYLSMYFTQHFMTAFHWSTVLLLSAMTTTFPEPVRPPSAPAQASRPKPDTSTGLRSSPLSCLLSREGLESRRESCTEAIYFTLGHRGLGSHQPGWRFCGSGKELRRGRLL